MLRKRLGLGGFFGGGGLDVAVVRPFNNVSAHNSGAAHALAAAEWTLVDVATIAANVTLTPAASAVEGQVCGAIVSAGNGTNTLAFAGVALPLGALVYTGESALITWNGSAWVLVDVVYDYASRAAGALFAWTVADAAARLALAVTAADVNKLAFQLDVAHAFVLLDNSPMRWGTVYPSDVAIWRDLTPPAGTATIPQVGFTVSSVGTLAANTPATTNSGTALLGMALTAGAAAINTAFSYRNATGIPPAFGVRIFQEFSLQTVAASWRWAAGVGGGLLGTASDVVNNVSCAFFGRGNGEANVQFYVNDAAGTCTQTDLGASFPAATAGTRYLGELYTRDGTAWAYNLLNVGTGAEISGTAGSNLPPTTTNMQWQWSANTNADAVNCAIKMGSVRQGQLILL